MNCKDINTGVNCNGARCVYLPLQPAGDLVGVKSSNDKKNSYLCAIMISKQKVFENIGKICMDASKLAFGSLVLGTIIKGNIDRVQILVAGSIAALLLAVISVYLLSKK